MDNKNAFLLKKVGLYQLEILTIQGEKIDTGVHQQVFVGTYAEVHAWADSFQRDIEYSHPEFSKVTVKPALIEKIGEKACAYLSAVIDQAATSALLAQHLAGELALMRARTALELNPDIAAMSQKIIAEGCQAVAALRTAQNKLPPSLSRA